jgi:uncharacterized tellurite resistance protein B-like protein
MFEKLIEFFSNPNTYETPMPKADADHVIGALMVRAAKADRAYLFEEVETIDRVLSERHNIGPIDAAKMRAACERLEEAMPDTVELAAILREAVGTDELEDALRSLWRIVFADGIERDEEDEVLHKVEAMLGVTPERAKELHHEVISTKLGVLKV